MGCKIYNSQLHKELQEAGKLQILDSSKFPVELAEKILPVMEVNPKLLRRTKYGSTALRTTSGTNTIFTTNSNQDFYITDIVFSYAKDVNCDTATGSMTSITATIDGATRTLCSFVGITLTADAQTMNIHFSMPLKVDRSSVIATTGTFGAGAMTRQAVIFGYYDEQSNA